MNNYEVPSGICLYWGLARYSFQMATAAGDKAILYFDRCLINPPIFPGTLKSEDYLRELGYEYAGGFKDLNLVSERVGEVLGAALVKVVIAVCINTVTQESCTKSEIRQLEKKNMKVYENKNKLVLSWQYQLNMERAAVGAARNLDYLIEAGKPEVTLQNEMDVTSFIRDYRYECMREFSPGRLQELLFDEIVGLTGYRPTY